jgi:hypothetical protein
LPLTIPAFVQYQAQLVPLRGLWNRAPPEGDYFVNAEIDWLVSPPGNAVQFALAGNSPVALSQIAALAVDNGRSGADCDFIFPDSGFVLTVPAHNQLISPVFTNALMFYASSPAAILGDTTVLQILNSLPPPIPIAPSSAQNHASSQGIPLAVNGSTPIIAAGITGTLNTLNINVSAVSGASAGFAVLSLIDGTGKLVWQTTLAQAASTDNNFNFPMSGLSLRFANGLSLSITGSTYAGDWVVVNAFYSQP